MPGASARSNPLHVRFGEFELDEANALLLRGGSAIALSPTPFGLLCALARHPGALLTKHTLLDEVWGHRFVSDSVLKGAISDVRTVLDDDPQHPRFIETVPRRGYRFIAALTALSAEPPPSASAGFIRAETDLAEQASASTRASAVEPPHASFVGRAKELASLRRAWDRVTSGKRVVFWVAGEPGIGKTTLIDRFVSGLGDIACARGHCVQHYGSGEPYHPVLEALAELCRNDTAVPSLLRAVAPTWLLQLPWLSTAEQREALLRELVGVNLERMLREMGEFLDRYTERRPLLLVTEDLHWGDRATIQLIDYLARRRSSGSLMWLSSFRLAEVIASDHPLNALRHELHLHGLCEEIVLDSFSEAEVAAYVAERSPSMASDESFVRALHERTEGVPLFVASVTSDVAARSAQGGVASAAAPRELSGSGEPVRDHRSLPGQAWQRTAPVALGGCRVRPRVSHRHAGARARTRRPLGCGCVRSAVARAALARCFACEGSRHFAREAVFLPSRSLPASPLRSPRAVRSRRASPQGRGCARAGASDGGYRRRGGTRDALRSRPGAAGGAALLRRGSGSGSAAREPGRMHELDRACVESAGPGAGRCGTHLARDCARDIARRCRFPLARGWGRSTERLSARLLTASGCSAPSDARPAAARARVPAQPARGVRRGACHGGSS